MIARFAALLATTLAAASLGPGAQAVDGGTDPAPRTRSAAVAAPDARSDAYVVREDVRLVVRKGKGVLANDRGVRRAGDLVVRRGDKVGVTRMRANGALTFVPRKGRSGVQVLSYRATGARGSDRAKIRVRVLSVNDAPSFEMEPLASGLTATEDTPAAPVAVVRSTRPAPPGQGERSQSVRVEVTAANPAMFATQPTIGPDGKLSYVLARDAHGSSALVLTPRDSGGTRHGGRDTGTARTLTLNVAPVDDAPLAVADTATAAQGAAATAIDVLANDTDTDGGPKTITAVTQPAHGTVAITGGGTGLTFRPAAGFHGQTQFTYTLNGGSTATVTVAVAAATVPVTPGPTDAAPVAVADTATVAQGAAATAIDVLANDTDTDGGPKTITAVTQPANGTVAITGGGTGLTFRPAAGFHGQTQFTYTLNGGSTATVTVTVRPVENVPGAVADTATVAEDSTATAINVLANDTAGDGRPKTIIAVTQPANGTVAITGGGTGGGTGLTFLPAANFAGQTQFTYTLNGGSTATVTVTVTPVVDAATMTVPAGRRTYTIGGPAAVVAPELVLTNVDTGTFTGATVANENPAEGDVLTWTARAGITVTYTNFILTLTGQASVADYQAVLRSVSFSSTLSGETILRFTATDANHSASTEVTLDAVDPVGTPPAPRRQPLTRVTPR